MKLKNIFMALLIATMALTMVACQGDANNDEEEEQVDSTEEQENTETDDEEDTEEENTEEENDDEASAGLKRIVMNDGTKLTF